MHGSKIYVYFDYLIRPFEIEQAHCCDDRENKFSTWHEAGVFTAGALFDRCQRKCRLDPELQAERQDEKHDAQGCRVQRKAQEQPRPRRRAQGRGQVVEGTP